MMLASCTTTTAVTLDDGHIANELYYDYGYGTNYTIIYYRGVPYYRYWYNNAWRYYLVPRERFPYIRRWDRHTPPPRNHYGHNPHRGLTQPNIRHYGGAQNPSAHNRPNGGVNRPPIQGHNIGRPHGIIQPRGGFNGGTRPQGRGGRR